MDNQILLIEEIHTEKELNTARDNIEPKETPTKIAYHKEPGRIHMYSLYKAANGKLYEKVEIMELEQTSASRHPSLRRLTREVLDHWKEIYTWFAYRLNPNHITMDRLAANIRIGADECAYCKEFNTNIAEIGYCKGCPIYAVTNQAGCAGTPFLEVENAFTKGCLVTCREATKRMYTFLQKMAEDQGLIDKPKKLDCRHPGQIHVNQTYRVHKKDVIIKGAWDGAYPDESYCWFIDAETRGHSYTGHVTKVKNVWSISEKEFDDMCRGKVHDFMLV